MHEDNSVQWIEGISNEVSMTVLLLLVFTLSAIYLIYTYNTASQPNIHPERLADIEHLRETMNVPPQGLEATAPPAYNQDWNCPICFGPAQFAVQTNCGHLYCCNCFVQYWHSRTVLQAVACPVCRTTVGVLLQAFSDTDTPDTDGYSQAVHQIHGYNRRFSGQRRSLWEHMHDIPVLLPYLIRSVFSINGLVWMFRLRVLVCVFVLVIYILSPLDIIPEAVFGLVGLLDDLLIAFVFVLYITMALGQFLAQQPEQPS